MKHFIRYILWVLCATLWSSLCFVLPDFVDNPHEGWINFLPIIAYITACFGGTFFLLYIIGCNHLVCAVLLPIFGVVGSVVSFYRWAYHATFTPMIIEATLHTNMEEVSGLISWPLIIWVLLNLIIALLLCRFRFQHIQLTHAWLHAIVGCLLGISYFSCNARLQNGLCQRYPYIVPYNIAQYISLNHSMYQDRIIPAYAVEETPDSLTIILVLGEAVRADHVQLNGYDRETTPRMISQKNVVSFPNIYSEQTHTLASLPYILTRADSVHDERQHTESSFISIFRNEGYQTSWLSNQDIGTTFAPFIAECDTAVYINAGKSVYVFSPWLDEEILPVMDDFEKKRSSHKLYLIHTIGSHWYYNFHVPEAHWYFQPVTTNRLATLNTIEQLTNSYDNTVRYMDYVLNEIIQRMETKNALVIYQADHGEALGEDGEYLHANETEMAKHPACIVWYSDKYAASNPDKIQTLVANKDKRYRTDYVFYSILYAAGIEAEGDCETMNIFR